MSRLHKPAPVFHMKGTLGELVTMTRKCVDGCGHPWSDHVVSSETLEGYCDHLGCACTRFDNFDWEEKSGKRGKK